MQGANFETPAEGGGTMRDEGISNAGFAAALAVVDCGMMNQQTEKDVML